MKHLKVYEDFSSDEKLEEGAIRKFLTGHKNGEEVEESKKKILSDIDKNINKMVSSGHLKEEDVEDYKDKLIKQATKNKWKGKVLIRKSKTGKYFVVYDDGTSSLQDLEKLASSSIK